MSALESMTMFVVTEGAILAALFFIVAFATQPK